MPLRVVWNFPLPMSMAVGWAWLSICEATDSMVEEDLKKATFYGRQSQSSCTAGIALTIEFAGSACRVPPSVL